MTDTEIGIIFVSAIIFLVVIVTVARTMENERIEKNRQRRFENWKANQDWIEYNRNGISPSPSISRSISPSPTISPSVEPEEDISSARIISDRYKPGDASKILEPGTREYFQQQARLDFGEVKKVEQFGSYCEYCGNTSGRTNSYGGCISCGAELSKTWMVTRK